MIAPVAETVMNLLLSAFTVVFFALLVPVWAIFYGGVMIKDFFLMQRY